MGLGFLVFIEETFQAIIRGQWRHPTAGDILLVLTQ
jgi:hypothetical protein